MTLLVEKSQVPAVYVKPALNQMPFNVASVVDVCLKVAVPPVLLIVKAFPIPREPGEYVLKSSVCEAVPLIRIPAVPLTKLIRFPAVFTDPCKIRFLPVPFQVTSVPLAIRSSFVTVTSLDMV